MEDNQANLFLFLMFSLGFSFLINVIGVPRTKHYINRPWRNVFAISWNWSGEAHRWCQVCVLFAWNVAQVYYQSVKQSCTWPITGKAAHLLCDVSPLLCDVSRRWSIFNGQKVFVHNGVNDHYCIPFIQYLFTEGVLHSYKQVENHLSGCTNGKNTLTPNHN